MDPIKIGIGVSSVGRFLPLIGKAARLFEREKIPVEIVNQEQQRMLARQGEEHLGVLLK